MQSRMNNPETDTNNLGEKHNTKTNQTKKHNTENEKHEQHECHQKIGGEPRCSRRIHSSLLQDILYITHVDKSCRTPLYTVKQTTQVRHDPSYKQLRIGNRNELHNTELRTSRNILVQHVGHHYVEK